MIKAKKDTQTIIQKATKGVHTKNANSKGHAKKLSPNKGKLKHNS